MSQLSQAKARLAASNLLGAADARTGLTKTADWQKAARRIAEFLTLEDVRAWQDSGGVEKGVTAPEFLLEKCILVLETAPLTVNFEPYRWFATANKVAGAQSI